MTNKEYVLETLKRSGKATAQAVQSKAETMTGTELNAEDMYIPDFKSAVAKMNMLERPVGFVCKSTAGRVVKLLQRYDSTIYVEEPEAYASLWGFVWSTDPKKAKPFIAMSTSPYNIGDCCTENSKTYKSLISSNVYAPSAYPQGWEEVIV